MKLLLTLLIAFFAANNGARADSSGCMTTDGKTFCCGQRFVAKYGDTYYSGRIKTIYSDGNGVIEWDDGKDNGPKPLAQLPIVRPVSCSNGLCTGQRFTAKYGDTYYNGKVGTIYEDGYGFVQWDDGKDNGFKVLSALPRVNQVQCKSGYCTGNHFIAKYGNTYYGGTVGTIYDDGYGYVRWDDGKDNGFKLLSSLPRVNQICPPGTNGCSSLADSPQPKDALAILEPKHDNGAQNDDVAKYVGGGTASPAAPKSGDPAPEQIAI